MSQSRQLAAIMFTDIVGYTALMEEDEQAAFELLRKNRDLQKPIIERYKGKWLKEIGGSLFQISKTNAIKWFYLFLLFLIIGCKNKESQPNNNSYVLEHASIINVTNGEITTNQIVIVEDEVISQIGQIDSSSYPDGAIRVDCKGRFLIPGLWDMHVHTQDPSLYSNLYIANGITGIRDMGGNDPHTRAALSDDFENIALWKKRVVNGEQLGPQIVAARSIIDGPPGFWPGLKVVSNEQEAIIAVKEDKLAGADFIKVYSLLPAREFKIVAEEAQKEGLEICGHLSEYLSIEQALETGQRTIEHFSEGRYLVLVSDKGTDLENRYLNAWLTDADIKEAWHNWLTLLVEAANSYDTVKSKKLVRLLATSKSWQVPTWRLLRNELLDPRVPPTEISIKNYAPEKVKKMWSAHPLEGGLKDDEQLSALADQVLTSMRNLIAEMRNENVRFLAGSDSGNPGLVPGFALHDELHDLVIDAGFSPIQVLQMATLYPAEYLGLTNQSGTIEVGKIADMVILSANPLEDINNTREIAGVMVKGNYLNREKLDSLLNDVYITVNKK